ncbi:MAG: C45 family autoproteolytic acyltransferase/hydrolase [Rhodomicrobiaceae bacterium]
MTSCSLTFDAVAEAEPGPKWTAWWRRSWPAYEAWFYSRGGAKAPSRADCEAALAAHMPELVPVHRRLTELAGGSDIAARFLSTWCPPPYLGGCSIAALADGGEIRLARNYDLAPDLNEGLLLRTEWTGTPVMGMIEFLWGLSDGINAEGLCAALAYGGRSEVACGFGVTTIMRYVLETCGTVPEALDVLDRVPSHMAYNITLADRHGATVTVELLPGGGMRTVGPAIATNHQHGPEAADRPLFTRTHQRRDHLKQMIAKGIAPEALGDAFLRAPVYQRNYVQGFGTLFTAVYDPGPRELSLRWPKQSMVQRLDRFKEGQRIISYSADGVAGADRDRVWEQHDAETFMAAVYRFMPPELSSTLKDKMEENQPTAGGDWLAFGRAFADYYSRSETRQ